MTEVKVKGSAKHNHRQTMTAGKHEIVADAPEQFGGADSAANPHELLLASLGSCTSITMQMYAKRKGWDLQETSIDLKMEEMDDPSQAGKKITKIVRTISVAGDLTQEQVDGLLVAADKCPIHKILSGKVEISSDIKRLTNV